MMTQQRSRITWIDMAKGYGMILVILGHCKVGMLGGWIYTFHMPLFFWLSGYVFNSNSDFVTFIKKKSKSILVPYFCLAIPVLLYFAWHQAIMIPETEKFLNMMHFSIDATSSLGHVIIYKLIQVLMILAIITILNMIISRTRLKMILGK